MTFFLDSSYSLPHESNYLIQCVNCLFQFRSGRNCQISVLRNRVIRDINGPMTINKPTRQNITTRFDIFWSLRPQSAHLSTYTYQGSGVQWTSYIFSILILLQKYPVMNISNLSLGKNMQKVPWFEKDHYSLIQDSQA